MPVGFKNNGVDLADLFVEDTEWNAANLASILNTVDGAGSNITSNLWRGYTKSQIICAGCDWTCEQSCSGSCYSTCTGTCANLCTGCTGCGSVGENDPCGGCGGCQGGSD